ncbi:hypothetical protein [Streptomyces canus]|uniref:hypothetical protein n=1 Tax=Streptomyces canus TaxID=58343 RepID=UPI003811984A
MPQESAGCAVARKPALVLLVGLVLMLLAHVVSCALHSGEEHPHATAATMSSAHEAFGADILPLVSDAPAFSAAHGSDGHQDHGTACCDPADRPADLRTSAGALFLSLLLLALFPLRDRARDLLASGAPPGQGTAACTPTAGLHLLRFVCVSRT